MKNVILVADGTVHHMQDGIVLCTRKRPEAGAALRTRKPSACDICKEVAYKLRKGVNDLSTSVFFDIAASKSANKLNSINNLRNMYAAMDEVTGDIYLSAYISDDPLWENNHIIIKDARGSKHHSVLQVLSNVLAQAHVTLKIE